MDNITKNTARNTTLLYILTAAKLIFPFLTLPYLTRVLTTEAYGVVAYVKSCMNYMNVIIDFGFLLSAVKDIVNANGDKQEIGLITGNVIMAKSILGVVVLGISSVLALTIPILKPYFWFTFLYATSIAITAFFTDYLFRGVEKMHIVTIIFVTAKGIVTALTFILIRNDGDIMLLPIMEIVGNLSAVIVTWIFIKKLKIPVRFKKLKQTFIKLKDSAVYFFSNMASTAFSALNTLLIGIFIEDLTQIAFWSVCVQIVSAIQALYSPINDGIYPQMIKHKSLKFIGKVLLLFMPIVTAGCLFCFFMSEWVVVLIGGAEYAPAHTLFRILVGILFLSFPAMLFGWPTLGAIGKAKEVTISTIVAAVTQIVGLGLLIIFNVFTIYTIAFLRIASEAVLMLLRLIFIIKNKKQFNLNENLE